jgi:hypothetical protein
MNIMGIVELHSTLFALVPLSNILVCLDFCPCGVFGERGII